MPITRDQVQYKVVGGARIVRFEHGHRKSYADGALIWLTVAELEKYKFIVEPVVAVAPPKHQVRIGVPTTAKLDKK